MPSSRRYRRYRRPLPSTKGLTAKIAALAVAATLAVGVLISAEMASGNDPALGPKATATAKKSTATPAASASSSSPSAGSGNDPYTQQYGSGYSYGSGSSGYSSSPAPVTSGTS
jgi:hypothetical protein